MNRCTNERYGQVRAGAQTDAGRYHHERFSGEVWVRAGRCAVGCFCHGVQVSRWAFARFVQVGICKICTGTGRCAVGRRGDEMIVHGNLNRHTSHWCITQVTGATEQGGGPVHLCRVKSLHPVAY